MYRIRKILASRRSVILAVPVGIFAAWAVTTSTFSQPPAKKPQLSEKALFEESKNLSKRVTQTTEKHYNIKISQKERDGIFKRFYQARLEHLSDLFELKD